MYKFDDSNSDVWLAQMAQYFLLNNIHDDETKLRVGALYLDQERWQWWKWHKKCYPLTLSWNVFSKALCDCFDLDSHFLGRLTKLRRTILLLLKIWPSELKAYEMPFTWNFLSVAWRKQSKPISRCTTTLLCWNHVKNP